jgi:hypothetical protein
VVRKIWAKKYSSIPARWWIPIRLEISVSFLSSLDEIEQIDLLRLVRSRCFPYGDRKIYLGRWYGKKNELDADKRSVLD